MATVKKKPEKIDWRGTKVESSNHATKDFVFGDGNFKGLVEADGSKKK